MWHVKTTSASLAHLPRICDTFGKHPWKIWNIDTLKRKRSWNIYTLKEREELKHLHPQKKHLHPQKKEL